MIAILIMPPRYEAVSRVMLNILKPDPVTGIVIGGPAARTYITTQTELIKDYGVAETAVDQLNWAASPDAITMYQASGNTDVDIRRWLAARVVEGTSTRIVPGTNILEISYRSNSPSEAKRMADAVRDAFIVSSLDNRRREAARTADWYEIQAGRERALLNQADSAKTAFEKESGVVMQGDVDLDSARLRALSSQASVPTAMMAPMPAATAPSAPQLAQLDAAIANAAKNLGPNHPQMIQLRAQRASVAQIVAQEMAAAQSAAGAVSSAAAASSNALQQAVQAQAAKVIQNRDKIERLNQLQAEVNQRRELYNRSLARIAELRQEASVADSGITILSEAATPRAATFPNKPLILGGGLGLGLGIGVLLSLLLELFQRRVRSVEDLQGAVDVPVLAVIEGPTVSSRSNLSSAIFAKRRKPGISQNKPVQA
jgi:uncharacterized protein involved in exopolysaccharide biosynthesis